MIIYAVWKETILPFDNRITKYFKEGDDAARFCAVNNSEHKMFPRYTLEVIYVEDTYEETKNGTSE